MITYAKIRAQAFESVPGSSEQAKKMALTDSQYWPESESCPYYGQLLKAENLAEKLWAEQCRDVATSYAFSDHVEKYGYDAVFDSIFLAANSITSESIAAKLDKKAAWKIERAAWRKERDLNDRLGRAGDLKKLAKLYQGHVTTVDTADSIGWGSYCSDMGGGYAADTYKGVSDAGKLAIEAVKAGARPVTAMREALKEVKASLMSDGMTTEDLI